MTKKRFSFFLFSLLIFLCLMAIGAAEGDILVKNDAVAVSVSSFIQEDDAFEMTLQIENRSEERILFVSNDHVLNGWETAMAFSREIPEESTIEESIRYEGLSSYGIHQAVNQVAFGILVYENASVFGKHLMQERVAWYPYGEEKGEAEDYVPDPQNLAAVEKEQVAMYLERAEKKENQVLLSWVCINRTEDAVMYYAEESPARLENTECRWATELSPDCSKRVTVIWPLTNEAAESLNMTLRCFNSSNWTFTDFFNEQVEVSLQTE